MILLRTILFLGLAIHKLVWELLKRRDGGPRTQKQTTKRPFLVLIKFFKMLVLAFLVLQTLFLDIFPISDQPFFIRIMGMVIYLTGLTIAILSRIQLGKNWANLEDFQVLPEQSVVSKGIYRYIRHPIYTGDILLLIGLELALNSWLVVAIIFLLPVITRQTLAEEALLSQKLSGYSKYRKRTKMFIPFIL